MYNYDYPLMHGRESGWGFGMLIICLLFIALIVAAIVRYTAKSHINSQPQATKTPTDIAHERYAKGEITKTEFDQLKKDLT